jgi:hypothetical protein
MKRRAQGRPRRPPPVEGVRASRERLAASLGSRPDRWSNLISKSIGDEYDGQVLVSRPALSPEEHADLAALTPAAHADLRKELDTALVRLRELLAVGDPFYILAVIQDANLFIPWGEYYEPTHEGSEAKVELVAGLLATQPVATNAERPSAEAVQAIFDEVDHITEVNLLFNLSMPQRGDYETAALRFMTANRWMSLRGTSFAGHGEDLARQVYEPMDAWLESRLGFTIGDAIQVGKAAIELLGERRNELGRAAVDAANAAIESIAKGSRRPSQPAQVAGLIALLSTTEEGIRDARTLTAGALFERDPTLEPARVAAVLTELSVTVGSLPNSAYTGLFDENPLRTRPFLELDGQHVLAIPGAMTRDIDRLLEARVMAGSPGFSKQRAKTLDRLAVDYLARMLPGAQAFTNLHYEETELDGLVLFDDIAFLVEGKGSPLSVPSQRGDTTRLGNEVGEAVEEAWRQGARARAYLLRSGGVTFRDEHGGEIVHIPEGRVRSTHIVNPTLHELAGLGPMLPRLQSLGLFASGEYPWSVFINDLRVIAETSENPAVFLHYLVWRARLPLGDRVLVTDEIDLWASYLLCERFVGLGDGAEVIVGNASTDFDAYYDGLAGNAPARDAPRKFLPRAARAFVDRLAIARPHGWREATGVVLDLSIPELALLDTELPDAAATAAREGSAWQAVGRLVLVAIEPGVNPSQALFQAAPEDTEATFAIAVRLDRGEPEIAWAQYRKPVTFALSEFERRALSLVSATGTRPKPGRSARSRSR